MAISLKRSAISCCYTSLHIFHNFTNVFHAEGTIEAEVVSAFEVSDAQAKSFATALKKKFGREVTLVTRVDKTLLGGIVIRAGDVVIDGSVRGRLQDLSSQFNQ